MGSFIAVRVDARTMGLIQATPLEETRASLEGSFYGCHFREGLLFTVTILHF